ncbi:MAG: glycosyltransferase [Alphaproteobacteria bacterium]|nr:glycosyltransferase [Alphaproteobacteria bacterium]
MIFRWFPHGGLQRDFLALARRLAGRGHAVDLLAGSWDGPPPPEGLTLRLFPPRGLSNHDRNRSIARQVLMARPGLAYDALVGFNRMPGLDVYYCGDGCYRAEAARRGPLYRLTPRFRQMAADEQAVFGRNAGTQILMLSPREQARYVALYGTEAERLHPVPPMIGRDRRRPPEEEAAARRRAFRRALGLQRDIFLVLGIGAAMRTKGVDRTVRALAALPADLRDRIRYLVIGGGETGRIARLARRLGVGGQVLVAGPRDDVPDALLAADLLAHPARRENTGQAILEAVVAGLPVLATENCGYSGHIREAGAGRVLPEPFDRVAFSKTLADMLVSPQRPAWSRNGAAYGRSYELYGGLDHAAALIEELAAERPEGVAA